MDQSTWQLLLALAVVAWALGYLMRLGWQTLRKRQVAGCGTCRSCPAAAENQEAGDRAFVTVDELLDAGSRGRR